VLRVSPHFYIQELVAPELINELGEQRAANLIGKVQLDTLELLRSALCDLPITINNWADGGDLHYSGMRPPYCQVGAKYSGHKFGWCFDLHHSVFRAPCVGRYIIENQGYFPYIIRLENPDKTPTWTHVEIGWHGRGDEDLIVFNP
jgi:hypothetical protein